MENKDSVPIWQKHRDILAERGVDFDKIIELRKHFHKNPEGGFQEFETQKKILEQFTSLEEANIKKCADTGLVIDITGTAEESNDGECNCIAFRADMDALEMKEETGVAHESINNFAHMCGHDGHMATLIATSQFWIQNRHKIPKNKTIRLLFQPAEEQPGGAKPMVEEGCMEGVDEVYGYHNAPFGEEGSITIKDGRFMAGVVTVDIEIEGRGGHGSEPAKSIDPITAACNLHSALHTIKSRNTMNTDVVAFTICELKSGSANNVIPRLATMRGTVRYYDEEVKEVVCERIKTLTETISEAFGCTGKVTLIPLYPPVINHEKQTQIFIDIAKEELGEERVNTKKFLPWFASEDFSFFLHEKPGAFVVLNNVRPGEEPISLHSSKMDFNDNIISTGAYLNIRLSEHRLGVKLL